MNGFRKYFPSVSVEYNEGISGSCPIQQHGKIHGMCFTPQRISWLPSALLMCIDYVYCAVRKSFRDLLGWL